MYSDWDRKHPFFLQLRLKRRHDLYQCHACSKDYLDLYISHMARVMGKGIHSIESPADRCAVKRPIEMKKARETEPWCALDPLFNLTDAGIP